VRLVLVEGKRDRRLKQMLYVANAARARNYTIGSLRNRASPWRVAYCGESALTRCWFADGASTRWPSSLARG
jgi:hypothetical protein